MPAWITAYLQRAPKELRASDLRTGTAPADWWTLGEDFDVEAEAVDVFMKELEWIDDPLGFGLPDKRPVNVHVWTEPDRVAEELGELHPHIDTVRQHLTDTCAIVALELGWSQLATMHEVVAFEIAYWLAETYQGVILGNDGHWYDHANHRWEPYR